MYRILTLPILIPMLMGLGLLIWQPEDHRIRKAYVTAAAVLTSAVALICIYLNFTQGSSLLACILVRFSELFSISLRLDGAGMVYGTLVAVLWPLATVYALDYMAHDGHQNRFFSFWLLTYGVVLGIAFSEDFLSLYFFYELMTLTCLPMVMHKMDAKARFAGRKYLIYSLAGASFAFMGIVFLLQYGVGHLNFTYGGVLSPAKVAGNETALLVAFVAAFFGFGVKAAIFPFHSWMPDLVVSPTPVSALLHAVAVVKGGVFAIVRLIYFGFGAPFLAGTWAQTVVMTATIITIVYGSARALRTPHLKRRLAFSTLSNLSYILFSLTLMSPVGLLGGLVHMIYHAFTKITMYCCAGSILHQEGQEYIYEMEGLGRRMPITFGLFTLASFALIGVPPLGGFTGKWMISEAAVASGNPLAYAGIAALIMSTLLTALYLLTLVVRAYFPLEEKELDVAAEIHEPGWGTIVPMSLMMAAGVVLALCSDPLIRLLQSVSTGLL